MVAKLLKVRHAPAAAALFVFLASLPLVGATRRFRDYVPFDGDTLHYQFQAVNLLYGHGFQVGPIEPYGVYRFDRQIPEHDFYRQMGGQTHAYIFGHVPGYQLVVAAVYSVFGVHPRVVYKLQSILVALIAALLPLAGAYYWGGRGVLSGLLAAALLVLFYQPNPAALMTEPLLAATLFVAAVPFALIERGTAPWVALVSGTLLGLVLLVKTITIFLLPLFLVLALYRIRSVWRAMAFVGLFGLGLSLSIAPWSLYATRRNDFRRDAELGVIVLATQGRWVVLDGNNELALSDGKWHPEWRFARAGDPAFFYNRPEGAGRSSLARVARFLWLERAAVPGLLGHKLARAFGEPRFFVLIAAALAFYGWALRRRCLLVERAAAEPPPAIPLFPLAGLACPLMATLLVCGEPRVVLPFVWPLLLVAGRVAVAGGEAVLQLTRPPVQ
jgi:hypothetical protein